MLHNSNENTPSKAVVIYLKLEFDSEKQQQILLKLIHDTTKVSTSKDYSQLLVQNPKATDQETKCFFTTVAVKHVQLDLVLKYN